MERSKSGNDSIKTAPALIRSHSCYHHRNIRPLPRITPTEVQSVSVYSVFHPNNVMYTVSPSTSVDEQSSVQTPINRTYAPTAKAGYLLRYQAPLISATVPKSLCGPLNFYDLPDIRDNISQKSKARISRLKQNHQITQRFLEDQELNAYFGKKKNWVDKSKFINTNSFYAACKVYLPDVKKANIENMSAKYSARLDDSKNLK